MPEEPGAALFVAPEAPYPLVGGGAIRSASLLHYLADRYRVDAVVFRQPGAPHPAGRLPSGLVRRLCVLDLEPHRRGVCARTLRNAGRLLRGVPPLVDRFSGFAPQAAAFLAGQRYDLALVEHFWCAPYWQVLAPHARRTVLDLHNIESVLHARCAATEGCISRPAHRLFEHACRRLERRWLPRYDILLVTSPEDARAAGALSPAARTLVYPNALPAVKAPPRQEDDAIVFTGNLEYHPNVTAVRFFRTAIWPLLRRRWPRLRWRLVGMNPHGVARHLTGDTRIDLVGPVDDAVAELARAKVAVVPLLAGSGTRFKILEAWAAAVPVVSTHLGAEGLPGRDGEHFLLADGPTAFAEAVSRLLSDDGLRLQVGARGRALFESEFTWPRAWQRLHSELASC